MKKIRSIKQLKAEKRKLGQQKADLERTIRNDWQDLRQSFTRGNSDKGIFNNIFDGKKKEEEKEAGVFEDTIAYLAERFARKIAGKAGEKFATWFKK